MLKDSFALTQDLAGYVARVRAGQRVVELNGRSAEPVGTVDWPGRREG